MLPKKKLKFAIIGEKNANTDDLKHEIKKRGHLVEIFPLRKLVLLSDIKGFSVTYKGCSLENFDIFLFRAYNINKTEARIISNFLKKKGKTIIEEALSTGADRGKISQSMRLAQNNIPQPKTCQAFEPEEYQKVLKKFKFPVVVKPIDGQKGQNIKKFDSFPTVMQFLKKNHKGFFVQEYITASSDLRVFVVGGRVIGGIRRFVIKGDFRSNASLGAKAEKIELNKKIIEISRKAAASANCEVAGVDLIENNRNYLVLEVNFTPQWEKFKETTGINPAREIIDYAIKKYEQRD